MKPLVYTLSEWDDILCKIKRDNPPSVWMIREKMKRKLGFTTREHSAWDPGVTRKLTTVHLDFYDERYRSLFLLRYGSDAAVPERFNV
jgi:hypothetical protein